MIIINSLPGTGKTSIKELLPQGYLVLEEEAENTWSYNNLNSENVIYNNLNSIQHWNLQSQLILYRKAIDLEDRYEPVLITSPLATIIIYGLTHCDLGNLSLEEIREIRLVYNNSILPQTKRGLKVFNLLCDLEELEKRQRKRNRKGEEFSSEFNFLANKNFRQNLDQLVDSADICRNINSTFLSAEEITSIIVNN